MTGIEADSEGNDGSQLLRVVMKANVLYSQPNNDPELLAANCHCFTAARLR